MDIRLHRNARTTPAIRQAIQQSSLSVSALARQFNLTPNTVRKWKRRPKGEVQDMSSRPQRMHTILPAWKEEIVVEIRKDLMLPLDVVQGHLRDYIHWLFAECRDADLKPNSIITTEAVDYLAERLKTPLQVQQHLRRALEQAFTIGENVITVDILIDTLSSQMDDLEPVLIRNGYNDKVISDQLRIRKADVVKFMRNELEPAQKQDIIQHMRHAGMPV
ncbi:MAG: hypothetical protein F6K62_10675 [Sphaerospermopsis sp. SIO1G2]|nr:hypothetical protein [Sphaerospermopsis sp. SIO1G2]